MSNDFKDDTFLARWLNDSLTEEELAAFKVSEDYTFYQKIIDGTSTIQSENFDQDQLLTKIKEHRSDNVRPLYSRRVWLYGAAASVAILLGFFYLGIFSKPDIIQIATKRGEIKTLTLPDGSELVLNANSIASFNEDSWEENRTIDLKGEAYFKVETGKTFTVTSSSGEVSVLGTQFNVQSLDGFFEVVCYEGSVKVVSGPDEEVLRPKRGFRKINRKRAKMTTVEKTEPSWIKNESTFASVPVKYVLLALENQYDIIFKGKTTFDDLTFSGTFPHNDLEVALKIVLGSLEIDYNVQGERTVVLED